MTYTTVPGGRAPIRMWADPAEVEPAAMRQLRNVANLPWTHGVAVMPDVHYGRGATVGSVIAMRDAVSPAAVGVDIGCGMSAVRTSLRSRTCPTTWPTCAPGWSGRSRWASRRTGSPSTPPGSTGCRRVVAHLRQTICIKG